jgi:hypothetical protein
MNLLDKNITPIIGNDIFNAGTNSIGVNTILSHISNLTVRISFVALYPALIKAFMSSARTVP